MDRTRDGMFRVGEFEVQPLDGQISGPAGRIHLQPKVMHVLVCLAESPGEIVSRAGILDEVWGEGSDADDALNRCISELRHHLGDDPEHPNYVQTIPKRGYRLVADVVKPDDGDTVIFSSVDDGAFSLWADLKRRRVFRIVLAYAVGAWLVLQIADVSFDALNLPDWAMTLVIIMVVLGFPLAALLGWALQVTDKGVVLDLPRQKRGERLAGGLFVFLALIVAGLVAYLPFVDWDGEPDSTAADSALAELPSPPLFRSSIAVLPFINLSENPDVAYIGTGLADELIHRLALLGDIKVAARTSSFRYEPTNADVPAIARELQVESILEGSIRLEDKKLRVLAQLIDSDGFHLWSESFNVEVDELLDVQSEIALAVAGRISGSLSPESEALLADKPTQSIDAFDLYLQAQDYLRRPRSVATLANARDLFQGAIDLDTRYADAYAGLCTTYISWFELNREVSDFENAESACHRSRTLADHTGATYFALGQLYRVSGQLDKAEDELLRGLELQPASAFGYEQLGRTYRADGKQESAEKMLQIAVDLAPGDWNTHKSMGNFLYRSGRYDDAVESYTRVVTLSPDNAPGFNNLASAYYMLDDFENAAFYWARSLELKPSRSAYLNTGAANYFTGEFEKAEGLLLKALEMAEDDFRIWGRLGAVQRHIPGKEKEAEESFRRARELAGNDLRINPDNDVALRYSALFSVRTGDSEAAESLLEKALDTQPLNPDTHLIAALVNLDLGREETALDNIELGIEHGLSARLVKAEPDFMPLHGNDRFERLTESKKNE